LEACGVTKHSEIAMLANLDAEMTTGRGDVHRLADLAPIGTRNHIAADICVAAGGASLFRLDDFHAAAFRFVGLFARGKKLQDNPWAGADHNYAADYFQPPRRHFLKTARANDNPIAIFRSRQIAASYRAAPCKVAFAQIVNRTKMFRALFAVEHRKHLSLL
jgi:hypothetical protein